ncbi:MAG: magnesium transporter, partial [Gammaproteobacteria bacterium]
MDTALPSGTERPDHNTLLGELFQDADYERVQQLMADLHPAEVAHFVASLSPQERIRAWQLLPQSLHGDVLIALPDAVRDTLIESMGEDELRASTAGLETDDVADLVGDLPEERAQQLLGTMAAQDRLRLESILSYPE